MCCKITILKVQREKLLITSFKRDLLGCKALLEQVWVGLASKNCCSNICHRTHEDVSTQRAQKRFRNNNRNIFSFFLFQIVISFQQSSNMEAVRGITKSLWGTVVNVIVVVVVVVVDAAVVISVGPMRWSSNFQTQIENCFPETAVMDQEWGERNFTLFFLVGQIIATRGIMKAFDVAKLCSV